MQRAPGEFVEDYDYSRSANPTRRALEVALGELEGGHGSAFASGMAADPRADHRRLLGAATTWSSPTTCTAAPTGSWTRCSPAGASPTTWSTSATSTRSRRAIRPETRLVWVETPTNPALNVIDVAGGDRARRGRTRSWRWTTRSRRPSTSARSSSAPARSCTRRRSTSAATPTRSAAPSSCATRRCTSGALRAERDRRRARAARLLPRPPRPAHAAPAHGRPRGERHGGLRVAARRSPACRDVRWPGFSGMVCLPAPGRRGDRRARRGSSRSPSRSAAWSRWSRSRRR